MTKQHFHIGDKSRVAIYSIKHDGGVSFQRATDIRDSSSQIQFYTSRINNIETVYLCIPEAGTHKYSMLFPFGMLPNKKMDPKLNSSFHVATVSTAKRIWEEQFKFPSCYHLFQ